MQYFKKIAIFSVFSLLTTLSFGAFAQEGGLKVGFVNVQALLSNAPQAAAAKKRVEKEFSTRQEELKGIQTEIKSLREKLTREGLTMSDEDRKKTETELLRKDREFRWNQGIIDEDFKIRRNEVMSQLQNDIVKAIYRIGQQEKFDLILTDGVIFSSSRVNLTETILNELKKSASGK